MAHDTITLATETIHNPAEPRHFMRFKPVAGKVVIRRGEQVLAESEQAMRLSEVGRDVYDPVVYVPLADLSAAVRPMPGKTSHCPLKGDASYYSLDGKQPIAWSYDKPLDFAAVIKGYVAFYGDQVTLEEIGTHALAPAP